jgi:hypothetical protein
VADPPAGLEAMLKKIEIKDNEKKLQIVSEHVPVSVSIFLMFQNITINNFYL